MFRRNKGKKEEESRFAKLRQGAANVLKDPKVRRETQRLAKDPRVQSKAKDGLSRVWQRLRRR